MQKTNPWMFDVRVRERSLKSGAITEKDVNDYLASLPDLANQSEGFAVAQPALAPPVEEMPSDADLDEDDEDDEDDDMPQAHEAAAPEAPAHAQPPPVIEAVAPPAEPPTPTEGADETMSPTPEAPDQPA